MDLDLIGWKGRLRSIVDPALARLDLGFAYNSSVSGEALLWEADPVKIRQLFGVSEFDLSDDDCVDFWVYLDTPGAMRLEWATPTGHNTLLPLTGDAEIDAETLLGEFVRQLDVSG